MKWKNRKLTGGRHLSMAVAASGAMLLVPLPPVSPSTAWAAPPAATVPSRAGLVPGGPVVTRTVQPHLGAQSAGIITTVTGGLIGASGPATTFGQRPFDTAESGNYVYILDNFNAVVWQINRLSGVETVVAGSGIQGFAGDDGPATSAELFYPVGIAVDPVGDLLIGDTYNDRVRLVAAKSCASNCVFGLASTSAGDIYTVAGDGVPGYSGNGGPAADAALNNPAGIAVDPVGNLLVADSTNGRVRLVAAAPCSAACPFGLTSMSAGDIYVVAGNGTPGYAGDGGPAAGAELVDPLGLGFDARGDLLVTDAAGSRVRLVASGSCSSGCPFGLASMSTGDIYTVAGNGTQGFSGDGGAATSAEIDNPAGVAVDVSGNLLLGDSSNNRVRVVAADSCPSACPFGLASMSTGDIYTVAGNGTQGFSGDGGAATSAEFYYPDGVEADTSGNVIIADSDNNRLRLLATSNCTSACPFGLASMSTGDIYTIAGTGSPGQTGGNGLGGTAALRNPFGVAIDGSGNLFVDDTNNNRIRFVAATACTSSCSFGLPSVTAGDIYTIAGTGSPGYSGDGGPATGAELNYPAGIGLDGSGDLLMGDTSNNRVRLVASSGCSSACPFGLGSMSAGDIYTVAGDGSAGYSGDGGPATGAEVNNPAGVTVDAHGNLLVADSSNNQVRLVASSSCISSCPLGLASMTTGDIYTVAGDGVQGYSGDGGPASRASLFDPDGIAVDRSGDLLVTDSSNSRVRLVSGTDCFASPSSSCPFGLALAAAGDIYTVAGDGVQGYSGDGGPAADAELFDPAGITVDGSGDLLLGDSANNRVRLVATSMCSTACPFGLTSMSAGDIYTVAGDGVQGYSGDGGPAADAELYYPDGIAISPVGDLYIADSDNNRIREVLYRAPAPGANGYWMVAADGGVFTYGDASFYGSAGAIKLAAPIVAMAASPDGRGYWMVAADGGVFTYGDASFYGSAGAIKLAAPIVAMAASPDGRGYWMVAADGGVFTYGDASFYGSAGAIKLAAPIVAMAASPDGRGYWMVAADGGVFTYGDASFYGSAGAIKLAAPIVAMAASPDGRGYWMVAADGGVFTYGDASFYGSAGAIKLAAPIVAMAASPDGRGYWMVTSAGQVFGSGDATLANPPLIAPNAVVVGMAA